MPPTLIALGISGRDRDGAAALAIDGRIVAAATEECVSRVPNAGYAVTDGLPASAVLACLARAGIGPEQVSRVTVVDEGDRGAAALTPAFAHVPADGIDAVRAEAELAAASDPAAGGVLVCGTDPAGLACFVRTADGIEGRGAVAGGECLVEALRRTASALGLTGRDWYARLDRLAADADADAALRDRLLDRVDFRGASGVAVDLEGWVRALSEAAPEGLDLADAASPNVRLGYARRAAAASAITALAAVVRGVAAALLPQDEGRSVAVGGALAPGPRFGAELRRLMGPHVSVTAVAEPAGRAIGAALATSAARESIDRLALGPAFTDSEIKRTLDNCRLDYVYEPDWPRLLRRISRLLAQGRIVAWFQGAAGFGGRARGTRSFLCDPAGRYARQNMNEYLRQVPIDEPLPIVLAPSVAAEFLGAQRPAFAAIDVPVDGRWQPRVSSALDSRQHARVQPVSRAEAPELCDLLETHLAETGGPGLIETVLAGPGEPVACTPRDAVRAAFSSSVDALVLGRFLLMKDYWLLRTHVD
jgi:carbamoyltransferase